MEIGRQVEEDEGGRGEVEAGREGGQEGGRELTSAEVDVILTRISANVEFTFFFFFFFFYVLSVFQNDNFSSH